jgi:hypothetical protein
MEFHIGKLIKKRLEEIGMTKTEFARRINKTSQNVYDIFDRKTIDTGLLTAISETLNYNFFEPLVFTVSSETGMSWNEAALTYGRSNRGISAQLQSREKELNDKDILIEQLKKEIDYLKEINALLKKAN